jgi:hypothetical protein
MATPVDLFGWGCRPEVQLGAAEFKLQCMVAGVLEKYRLKTWRYTAIPLGEKRDKITAARVKRMGAVAGFPDMVLIGPGKTCFMEFKSGGGHMSGEQADIATHLIMCGCGYALVRSFDEAINALKDWGVLDPRVQVQ